MAKLFRKGRFNFFQGKGIGQYLIYVVLEMVLVIAGILIALEINNANEAKKESEKIQTLLEIVNRDLHQNLDQLDEVIIALEAKDSLLSILLSDTLTWEEFKANPAYSVLIVSYTTFRFQDNGFQNLIRAGDYFNKSYDTLIPQLEDLFVDDYERIQDINKRVSDYAIHTIEEWEERHEWFRALGSFKMPEAAEAYFMKDPYFLNKAQTYRTYSSLNLLTMLIQAKYSTIEAIIGVSQKLRPKEDPYEEFSDYLQEFRIEDWSADTGYYKLNPAFSVHLFIEDGKLMVQGSRQQAVKFYVKNDSVLYNPILKTRLSFNKEANQMRMKSNFIDEVLHKID